MSTPTSSWWTVEPREGFSVKCCELFAVNFDNAPTFISRSEFIPVGRGKSHKLKKTASVRKDLRVTPEQARRGRANKHIGTRMSERAMQSASLVGVVSNAQ